MGDTFKRWILFGSALGLGVGIAAALHAQSNPYATMLRFGAGLVLKYAVKGVEQEVSLPISTGGASGSWGAPMSTIYGAGADATVLDIGLMYADGTKTAIPIGRPSGQMPAPTNAPSTASQTTEYSESTSGPWSSAAAACNSYWNNWKTANPNQAPSSAVCVSQSTAGCDGYTTQYNFTSCIVYFDGGAGAFPLQSRTVCPAGYTASGSTCNLSNARAAVSDGRVDVVYQNGAIGFDTADFDYVAGAPRGAISADGKKLNAAGLVADAIMGLSPTQITIEKLSNGNWAITRQGQSVDSAGNTQTVTSSVQLTSTGQPVATAQTAAASSLSIDPTTQTATQTTTGGQVASSQQPCSPGVAGQHNCEQTQQEIKDALTKKGDDPENPTPKVGNDFYALFPQWIREWSWTMPAHTSTCPVMSFGGVFDWEPITINAHCSIMDGQAASVAGWLQLAWILLGMFVFLSA